MLTDVLFPDELQLYVDGVEMDNEIINTFPARKSDGKHDLEGCKTVVT